MTQRVSGFIIDTNRYAGNFEREMCAFMTGMVGDCEVGIEYAERFLEVYGEELDFITEKANENGCYRPVEIYPTPGVWNNGMGFEYTAGQEQIALENWKNSMMPRLEKQLQELVAKGGMDSSVKRIQSEIQSCKEKTEAPRYSAYQSVCIHVHREPTADEIALLKKRAELFAQEKGIEITGYRLLFEQVEINTQAI